MAAPVQLSALLLCFLCSSITLVCSFNLEPRIPIVKKGSPRSHFGYSVAQHQTILDTVSGKPFKKSWILVGAPKDQNLQPGTNRSGALWKCPLTSYTTDCEQVKTDGFKDLNEALAEPAEDEIKDDQWLGVTLKSQGPGGKVLLCAHRYMHKGRAFQWGFGLCYILSQNLDLNDYLEPCRGKPVNEGHQQYGFCQAGTSGLLLEDEAVLGVPGPYTWRGTVHTSNISDNFLLKDKTQYFGPVTENDSPVDKYSYLGYSVTAGHFFGNYMSYVGGAPRANQTGQVVFFSREKIGESELRVDLILQGEMFASSFGFEVLAVDINGDRRDDLLVSAPFYYTSNSSGVVYVYMNNDGGFIEDHPFTKIDPPYTRFEGAMGERRFGFSMTSLGDLNHDGYKDIAIGAPYEGHGAIYIYLGKHDGLSNEYSQVIRAEDMPPGIPYNAFGYALSGGMDLDGNGYPDLLTSSFCSDQVLLIRARPIIDIQTEVRSRNLENIDPTKEGCEEDRNSKETCFSFDACFKMDNDAGTKTGLRLKYIIEEISDRPITRVRFNRDKTDQPSIVQRDINLRPEDMGRWACYTEIVYLVNESRNILQPLKFKLSYEIEQAKPQPVNEGDALPDIDDYPILNQQEAKRIFYGTFAKDCGDDDVCMSDLDVKGRLDLQKHEKFSQYVLRLGEQDTVSLHVEVKNTGEPAYQSSLLVTHHQALGFDPKKSQTGSHECYASSSTQVQCSIGNPLLNTSGPMILSFKESGFPFDSKYIQFIVLANSSSLEETPQEPLNFLVEVIKRAEISIIGSVDPEQAFYGGEVVGESSIKHMNQVGMEVIHKYVVDNRGPWKVDELQVQVHWPHQVENNKEQGKWLLYLTEIPTIDGIGECLIDQSNVNSLILQDHPFPEAGGFTEVEGELETTDFPGPDGKPPSKSEGPLDGGLKITKKVTATKKVTTSTTVKKQTSKSSSKDFSISTERTSQGFSSSSGSSTSRFSSSSGYSESGRPVDDDDIDGSGYGFDTDRQHGRGHSRVSRRVYSTERKSKYGSDLGINELDANFDDEDGDVISHHEESHSSTKTSPDGSTTLTESHHTSKKVTVKEGTIKDIPGGRWGNGGGYHRTYTETSSGTADIPDRRFHFGEESQSRQTGSGIRIDDNTSEGSGSHVSFDGSGHTSRVGSTVNRQQTVTRGETVRRTHSGTVSRDFGTSDRGEIGQTHFEDPSRHFDSRVRGETFRTHSGDASGGFSPSTRDETVRVTHSGGRDETIRRTQTGDISRRYDTHDGDVSRGSTRVDSTSITHSWGTRGSYDGFNRSEEDSRARYDAHGAGSDQRGGTFRTTGQYDGDEHYRTDARGSPDMRREGWQTHYSDLDRRVTGSERTYDHDIDGTGGGSRYEGGTVRTGGSDRSRQGGTHRVTTVDSSGPVWRTDGSYRRVVTEDTSRTYGADTSSRVSGEGDRNLHIDGSGRYGGTEHHRGGSRIDGYSRSSDVTGSSGGQDYRRRGSSGYERTSFEGGYDRTADHSDQRGFERAGEDRYVSRDGQRTLDWDDRGRGESQFSDQERDGSSRTHFRDYDRFGQESTRRRTHTHSSSSSTGHGVDDGETRRPHSESQWRSSGQAGDGLRITTFDSNAGRGEHNRASWSTHSAHGGIDHSEGHSDSTFGLQPSSIDNIKPKQNKTYTRVDVDPETGTTTVYTKTVYSDSWAGSWDHRPWSTFDSRTFDSESTSDAQTRHRRELTRVKREKELIIKPQAVTDAQTGKTMQVVNLRCDGNVPTAKCFTFTCNIRKLGAKQAASIRIKSRLWNSTLVEDYPRVSYVSIKSKAFLILPDDIREDQDQSDDVASAETLAYPDLLDQLPPEEVPLWVILVSIFAGLLVLIIIVLILWKLGFFERKRPDPTLSGNLDKDANGY